MRSGELKGYKRNSAFLFSNLSWESTILNWVNIYFMSFFLNTSQLPIQNLVCITQFVVQTNLPCI